ncbi:baculoviral IAP repeat-containing protein 2-like [Panonychus citri]|uniref:baculoviral IAP repeat-containing protein 2-like n=1 Tax=Panonychus citri TaxID=50023 RepID=UPI002307472C|nr:baculoviral IAP repeat-containing protein 2-like [Panonychus citri]
MSELEMGQVNGVLENSSSSYTASSPTIPPSGHYSMRAIMFRIDTYRHRNWNYPHLTPELLGSRGFLYLGEGDYIECVFCGYMVTNLSNDNDPIRTHNLVNPACPSIVAVNPGHLTARGENEYVEIWEIPDNEPTPTVQSPSHSSPPLPPRRRRHREHSRRFERNWQNVVDHIEGVDNLLLINETTADENISQQRAQNFREAETIRRYRRVFRPLFINYSSFDARLETFTMWPLGHPIVPSRMAEAGFIHNGYTDVTICFHCGHCISNWDADDDPWIEHVNGSPLCAYIYLMRGNQYIEARQSLCLQDH